MKKSICEKTEFARRLTKATLTRYLQKENKILQKTKREREGRAEKTNRAYRQSPARHFILQRTEGQTPPKSGRQGNAHCKRMFLLGLPESKKVEL